jgi:hypothetical protein
MNFSALVLISIVVLVLTVLVSLIIGSEKPGWYTAVWHNEG